jgi:hypothetical protein
MTPHSTKGNGGRLYRYYMSTRDSKEGHGASGVKMLPAAEVEQTVMAQVRGILASPEVVTQVRREICKRKDKSSEGMSELQVTVAMNRIDLVWDQLFPIEQHRLNSKSSIPSSRAIRKSDELGIGRMAGSIAYSS